MLIHSLLIEQVESDGTLKTFRMQSSGLRNEIVVAFADEYEEPREGPFYFLDKHYAETFARGFANCESRRLGKRFFRSLGGGYELHIFWRGVPTKPRELSFYSLSLPEYAIPKNLHIIDPHNQLREFRRSVVRDDQTNRFIIYLECRSKYGQFDFDLTCDFFLDSLNFNCLQYSDPFANSDGIQDILRWALEPEEKAKVQEFLIDDKIALYQKQNKDLTEIAKLQASRPINVEAKATAESKSMSEASKFDMRGANFPGGFAETNYGKMVETQINYAAQQNLAEAAAEIQQLLTKLQKQGYSQEDAQKQAAQDLAQKAQSNPTFKGELIKWGQSLGDAAAKTTVTEAAKEVFKLALKLLGVPLL